MFVVKRDGRKQDVHFDKITARITKLSYGLNPDFCDPVGGRGCCGEGVPGWLGATQLSVGAFWMLGPCQASWLPAKAPSRAEHTLTAWDGV